MRTHHIAAALVTAALGSLTAAAPYGQWTEQNYGLATFLAGVSFTDASYGWTIGGTNGVGSVIHRTTDGGASWSAPTVPSTLMLLACDAVSNPGDLAEGHHAWVGGVQFLTEPGMLVTHDGGQSWNAVTMPGSMQWSTQCVQAVDDQHIRVPSSWADLFGPTQSGICVSNDGGNSWTGIDWGIPTFARYCDFLDADRGWMTGGAFPEDRAADGFSFAAGHPTLGRLPSGFRTTRGEVYQAAIARTSDGGQTWTQLFWDEGNFYLNQICMVNEMTGWAVGGGPNYTPYLLHTNDGWATWEYQTTPGANYTLTTIDFVNSQTGFALGFGPDGLGDVEMICLHTTDGGANWTADLPGLTTGPLDAEFLGTTTAWSVGSNNMNLSTVAMYEAQPDPACPEDINGDDLVDVNDVLGVIESWGDCPACPGDTNGDGAVDVDDLLAVVAAWGPCS